MAFSSIESRIAKLEQLSGRKVNPDSTIFVQQISADRWEVFNPESTGRVKNMSDEQLEKRPRDHAYLFLELDGGVYLEEPE